MPLLLRESHLHQLLTMRALIPLMEQTLAAFSAGGAVQPLRPVVPVDAHRGFLAVMPAYLVTQEAIGLKAVAVYPDNPARGLPSHLATILLLDAPTGVLLAVMDGRLITEMRTAAVSAAVTAKLAGRPVRTLALLGAGVQARSHLHALREIASLAEVRVWSRTRDAADRFAAEMRERLRLHVVASGSPRDAARGADVICTVTSSRSPVLEGAWLEPGVHINAVGAARPDWRELDTDAVSRSHLFVDSRASAVAEAGDLVMPVRAGELTEAHVLAEVGEVFAGMHPGRTGPDEITLFESVGLAVEDVASARLAYEHALARGIGDNFSLE
ncbi:MAG TPA: ornithine cyclodeaminase family protein [bacterium]|nr:ornithine cyclodeaminase family protein [bacterium]